MDREVSLQGRSRAFGGVSVLLAMARILQKERMNRYRVELMQEAIEKIQVMDPAEFKKTVQTYQKELLQDAKIAELVQRKRQSQQQYVPFRMVCAWCRKIGVRSTHVKIVSKSYRVSIDRDLLDHIEVIPDTQTKEIRECLLVGSVLCKGEPEPGSRCKKPLGRVIKYRQIPFVILNIKCFAFYLDDQEKLEVYKQWKDTQFAIDDLSSDDIERYLDDNRVLPNNAQSEENELDMDFDA